MKFAVVLYSILLAFNFSVYSQTCTDRAKEVAPVLTDDARKSYYAKLAEARGAFLKNPNDADALIWLGRRTAYVGEYKAAIKIFTEAIQRFPKDARIYRHRGHRYITLRCFDDAVSDLQKAGEITRSKPDEIEPDGLPNSRGIPTSTLQTNIWYHLGLAQYLKGDFSWAAAPFMNSFNRARTPDMKVAAAYWVYMSARRYGEKKDADRLLRTEIRDGLEIIENQDYYKLIKLNKGQLKAADLLNEIQGDADTLGSASIGYGLGNYFLYNGDKEKAAMIFSKIVEGNQWASFGYIAAEVELNRKESGIHSRLNPFESSGTKVYNTR